MFDFSKILAYKIQNVTNSFFKNGILIVSHEENEEQKG